VSIPRKNHYLSEFFLANFTQRTSRKDFLTVVDLSTGKIRRSRPKNEAVQRDYFRVDAPGVDDFAFEKLLAQHEGRVANTINQIISTSQIPDEQDFDDLLLYIAHLYISVPKPRELIRKSFLEMSDLMLEMSVSSKERWEETFEQCKEVQDGTIKDIPSYEEMFEDVMQKRIKSAPNASYEVALFWQLAIQTLPYFAKRQWSVFVTTPEHPFITSDFPVVPYFEKDKPNKYAIGLADVDLSLWVPISSTHALLGSFELQSTSLSLPPADVGSLNSHTLSFCHRYAYAANEGVPCCLLDGRKGTLRGITEEIHQYRQSMKKIA